MQGGVCIGEIREKAQFTGLLRGFKSIIIRAALMVILHVVLRDLTLIGFHLLGQEVLAEGLLQ